MISALIDGVLAHEPPLLRVQRSLLQEHAVGDADLADVVQVGRLLHLLEQLHGPAQLVAEHHGVGGDARGVAQSVVVLGGEGGAQPLEVAQVQPLDLVVESGVADGERELHSDALEELQVGGVEGVRGSGEQR